MLYLVFHPIFSPFLPFVKIILNFNPASILGMSLSFMTPANLISIFSISIQFQFNLLIKTLNRTRPLTEPCIFPPDPSFFFDSEILPRTPWVLLAKLSNTRLVVFIWTMTPKFAYEIVTRDNFKCPTKVIIRHLLLFPFSQSLQFCHGRKLGRFDVIYC